MKIYRLSQVGQKPEEYGHNLTSDPSDSIDPSDPRVALVNWDEPDLYGGTWDERRVRSFLGLDDKAVIYQTLADISDLNESLAEEMEEDPEFEDGGYDWSELQSRRSFPPPIVITRTKNDVIVINDGNHRVSFWRDMGKDYIPSWCYDQKITEWNESNEIKDESITEWNKSNDINDIGDDEL